MNTIFNQHYAAFTIENDYRSPIFHGQYKTSGNMGSAGAFAADIVSRIQKPTSSDAETADLADNETAYKNLGKTASKSQKNLDSLQASLENTINAIAARHGAQAATQVMGIVYQNVGNNVGEESLGQGFLKAISFIDRNFGINEGNRLMSELNNGLNKEMNSYFDNGSEEVFFDAASPSAALRTAKAFMQQTNGVFDRMLEDSGSSDLDLSVAMTTEEMREMMLEAQAKRMLAKGEIPPAYLQEYLPNNMMPGVTGTIVNTSV